jgi:hypothetical protein
MKTHATYREQADYISPLLPAKFPYFEEKIKVGL